MGGRQPAFNLATKDWQVLLVFGQDHRPGLEHEHTPAVGLVVEVDVFGEYRTKTAASDDDYVERPRVRPTGRRQRFRVGVAGEASDHVQREAGLLDSDIRHDDLQLPVAHLRVATYFGPLIREAAVDRKRSFRPKKL